MPKPLIRRNSKPQKARVASRVTRTVQATGPATLARLPVPPVNRIEHVLDHLHDFLEVIPKEPGVGVDHDSDVIDLSRQRTAEILLVIRNETMTFVRAVCEKFLVVVPSPNIMLAFTIEYPYELSVVTNTLGTSSPAQNETVTSPVRADRVRRLVVSAYDRIIVDMDHEWADILTSDCQPHVT